MQETRQDAETPEEVAISDIQDLTVMAGAPAGNSNSSKSNRLWSDTIRRAAMQSDGERLRKIAEALLDKASEGDIQAIKELGDRLEGRAIQAIEQKTEMTATVEVSQRPQISKEEWLKAHGLGTATRTAE